MASSSKSSKTLLEDQQSYWVSNEGVTRRIEALSDMFIYEVYNNSLLVYGENNDVWGCEWVGSLDEATCRICDAGIGRQFRLGQFTPILPKHPNCRCVYRLISTAEGPAPIEKPKYLVKPENWEVEIDNQGSKDASKYDADRMIHYLPDKDLVGITKVTVVDAVGLGRSHGGIVLAQYEAGDTINGQKTGEINVSESVFTSEDKARIVLFHEVGHNVERIRPTGEFLEWYDFFSSNKDEMPNDYARTDHSEGFAECYAQFQNQNASPKIEEWFTSHGYVRKE